MTLKIYKYRMPLPSEGETEIELPSIAKFLTAQMQGDQIVAWFLVTDDGTKRRRRFVTIGTGWDLPAWANNWQYRATVQSNGYVWHLFELPAAR